MDAITIKILTDAGVDTEGAIQRFAGNDALYEKFLHKFAADENFAQAKAAMAEEDWENAARAIHTLKGVAGNLGLTPLFEACSEAMQMLRAEKNAEAKAFFPQIETAYQRILSTLNQR